ncbi:3578_t:CDS:2, partial [Cetraspora pellucida]
DIISTTTTLENNSKLREGSRKWSWIWDHFKDLPTNQGSKEWCKELKKMENKYGIMKFGRHELYVSQLANNEKSHQIKDNGIYKEQVNKALVKFIVTDSQPFYMLENPGFIKYSLVLSPFYKLPSNKGIKNKIYLAYDWMSEVVRSKIHWSHMSYIDPQFEMQETTLVIHELKHLHSGFTIAITLKSILQNWSINEKCFMITTDNAKNMIKAINKIEGVNQLACSTHTLQLVVSKGLLPIKTLVLMDDLVKILHPFANTTKMLGGSKYTTMSFMFTAISSLKKLLNIDNNIQITVDLDNSNTVFDDNLDL